MCPRFIGFLLPLFFALTLPPSSNVCMTLSPLFSANIIFCQRLNDVVCCFVNLKFLTVSGKLAPRKGQQ